MGKVRDAKNKASHRQVGDQMKRRKLLLEVRQEAAEFTAGLKRGMDPADAVQVVLDNLMTSYEYATQNVMELDTESYFTDTITGKRLNEWIVEQERLGLQLVHVAGKAASMGLAERQVRLREQQAAIFATVVEAAAAALGIDSEIRRQLHDGIATRLEDLEGTAEELEPRRLAA